MGKNKGDGYQNLAAKRFKDIQRTALMPESEVYYILQKDLETILDQMTAYRESQKQAEMKRNGEKVKGNKGFVKFPNYTKTMFANLSVAKCFYELVMEYKKGNMSFTKDQKESLKMLLAGAYIESISRNKVYPVRDDAYRCEYLCKAFKILDRKHYKVALELTSAEIRSKRPQKPDEDKTPEERRRDRKRRKKRAKARACEVIMQAFQDPMYGAKVVASEFDKHNLSDKKKLKLLKKLYEDRYYIALGTMLGIDGGNSDLVGTIKDAMRKMKKKQRRKILRSFAEYYKRFGSRNFLLDAEFYEKHKKIIKDLIFEDIGYKKAFADMDRKNISKGSHQQPSKPSMKAEDILRSKLPVNIG